MTYRYNSHLMALERRAEWISERYGKDNGEQNMKILRYKIHDYRKVLGYFEGLDFRNVLHFSH